MDNGLWLELMKVAGGAAAGAVAKEGFSALVTQMKEWRKSSLTTMTPAAARTAEENAEGFVKYLVESLARIEQTLERYESQPLVRLAKAAEDPACNAVVRDALLASMQTSVREKHSLLGALVAERLFSDPETIRALTTALAVECVPHLTSNQLSFMGLLVATLSIRPSAADMALPEFDLAAWWTSTLSPYLPATTTSRIDRLHLLGLRCVSENRILTMESRGALQLGFPEAWPKVDAFLKESSLGQLFDQTWSTGMASLEPTSIGLLIGLQVHSERTNAGLDISQYGLA